MKSDAPGEFDDPALKPVVKRVWGCERCPTELRQRLESLLGKEPATQPGRLSSSIFQRPVRWWIWPVAAAALVLLAVGLKNLLPTTAPVAQLASVLPATLTRDLIYRHDHCCGAPNHQGFSVSKDDDAGIAAAMRSQLAHAVLMARPEEPGWNFRGASICPVGSVPSGHLVFVKGADAISVFSLPGSIDPQVQDGKQIQTSSDHHVIVAFAKDGAFFCLVGSGPDGNMTADELSKLANHMQAEVTARQSEPRATVAELIYPTR